MVDTSIYGRIKTMSDYDAENQAYRANQQAESLRALQLMAGQQDMAAKQRAQMEAARLEQFVRGIPGDASPQQRVQAFRSQGFHPQADAMEKQMLDAEKERAEIEAKRAATAGAPAKQAGDMAEAVGKTFANYRAQLEFVESPQQAAQWMAASYQDPIIGKLVASRGTLDQALSNIPQDPQGFQQWKGRVAMGVEKWLEMAQRKSTEERNAANDTLVKDASGKWVPNQPLIAAKERVARAGASTINVGDRVPTPVVKQQDDLIDKISTATAIDADLSAIEARIKAGELNFGPLRNLINQGKNLAGASDPESRNLATFQSTLEKLRNDSLRLNSGVQTEGDAQRAWNELFQNITDTELVKQRMAEIRKINQRAAQLQKYRLDVLRKNFGAGPLEPPAIEPALQGPAGNAVDDLVKKYRSK